MHKLCLHEFPTFPNTVRCSFHVVTVGRTFRSVTEVVVYVCHWRFRCMSRDPRGARGQRLSNIQIIKLQWRDYSSGSCTAWMSSSQSSAPCLQSPRHIWIPEEVGNCTWEDLTKLTERILSPDKFPLQSNLWSCDPVQSGNVYKVCLRRAGIYLKINEPNLPEWPFCCQTL